MTDKFTQPEALRLADLLDEKWHRWKDDPTDELKAAAELRRLHAENADYGATIDYLTSENAEHIGEIVALKEQRDELLEALKLFPGFTDDATIGDSWLWKVGSTIAKTGGAA